MTQRPATASPASRGPRLIIEVCHGRDRGRKTHLVAGQRTTVGRTERASFVVARDAQLGGRHFSIAWDGEQATVRDEGAAGGTLLDGQAVGEGRLRHGSWIRAGQTDFQIFIEGVPTPPTSPFPARDPHPVPLWWSRRDELASAAAAALELRQPGLWGVLDASRHPDIVPLLRTSVDLYRSLYEGARAEALSHVAPYLVAFEPNSKLLPSLVQRGWGRRWGCFVVSPLSFEQTRRHLRRFLMVKLAGHAHPAYFRYYDPWVLASVWRQLPARQWYTVFGPFSEVLYEDPETGALQARRAQEETAWS